MLPSLGCLLNFDLSLSLSLRLIEGALDRAGPLETSISTRVNMTCSVVEYAVGETMISAFSAGVPEMLLLPAVHNKDDAWRRQMLSYVGFAIVAQAQ